MAGWSELRRNGPLSIWRKGEGRSTDGGGTGLSLLGGRSDPCKFMAGLRPSQYTPFARFNLMNATEEDLVDRAVESETYGAKPPSGGEWDADGTSESGGNSGFEKAALAYMLQRFRFEDGPHLLLLTGLPERCAAQLIDWIVTTSREAGLHVPSPLHVHRAMHSRELMCYVRCAISAVSEFGGGGVVIVDGVERVRGTGTVVRGVEKIELGSCSLVMIGTVPDTPEAVVSHPDCCATALGVALARNHIPVADSVNRLIEAAGLSVTNASADSCVHFRYGCFMEEDGPRIANLMLCRYFGPDFYPEAALTPLLNAGTGSVYQLEACVGMLRRQLELGGYGRFSRDSLCARLERYVRFVSQRRTWPTGRTRHVQRSNDRWAFFFGKEREQ
jgi:hypothetical protein